MVNGVFFNWSSSQIAKVVLSRSHLGKDIVASEALGVGFLDKCSLKVKFTLIADHTGVLALNEGERTIHSNISPDRVDEESDQVKSIAVGRLVLDKPLGVGFEFRDT